MFHYWISYSYSNDHTCGVAALFIELDSPIEYKSDVQTAEKFVRKRIGAKIGTQLFVLHWVELKGAARPM